MFSLIFFNPCLGLKNKVSRLYLFLSYSLTYFRTGHMFRSKIWVTLDSPAYTPIVLISKGTYETRVISKVFRGLKFDSHTFSVLKYFRASFNTDMPYVKGETSREI